jgi:hypothetical protein
VYYIDVQNTIFSLRLRERRRRSAALLSQSACTERSIPPLVEEETQLPSSDRGDTQTGRRSLKPTLEKYASKKHKR